jgi:hypothetical protein
VISEQGTQNVTLRPETGRVGSYSGQFPVLHTGPHRLELPLPDSTDEPLSQQIFVHTPNLEQERPQRNDALARELAEKTFVWHEGRLREEPGSEALPPLPDDEAKATPMVEEEARTPSVYYVGIQELLNPPVGKPSLDDLLKDRSKTSITGYSQEWEEQMLRWLMYGLFGLLCLEWLLRRLFKLA